MSRTLSVYTTLAGYKRGEALVNAIQAIYRVRMEYEDRADLVYTGR